MEDNIKGKVVVITGGSSGLGEDTARLLASRGAKVVIAARRKEKLDAIAEDIKKNGGEALVVKTDVTNRGEVKNLIDTAKKEFGKIDVLINNAGLMAIAPMAEDKVDEWDKMIDINVKGVLYGISAALPVFQEQGHGHFINLSSVAGIKVFSPGGTVYNGTLMINSNFDQQKGNKVIEDGDADLVAFGKPFISNPDLAERFAQDIELDSWDEDTFYSGGAKGYIDYKAKTDRAVVLQ